MSSPNLQVIFQAILAATNNLAQNAPQVVNYDFGNPTLGTSASSFYFNPAFQVLASTIAVPFPGASNTVYAVFVQNLTANVLTVEYTSGALTLATQTLGLNGVFVMFDPAETSGGGCRGLVLVAPQTTQAMVFVGL